MMKRIKRIMISIGCIVLLMTSWLIAVNAKSNEEKQAALMEEAALLMKDGIYIRAVPLLEEAAGYRTQHTITAEAELKKAYLALINTRGYRGKYIGLLELQLSRIDAGPEIYAEAAGYYLSIRRTREALGILRDGITKTGCAELTELYENHRYAYETKRTGFDYAAELYNGTAQVQTDGLWGIAYANGTPMIPCLYEQISTFSGDRAIVRKSGEIYAVDSNNNRVAKLNENAAGFGNFSENRFPLRSHDGWRRATGEFEIGTAVFEDFGMYSGGYAAAKINGRWGVIDIASDWLVPAEYDGIICDELGRCFAQRAVFARLEDKVFLFINGSRTDEVYENARPFSAENYAAVKKNGKWGFINADGSTVIDFIYDDALSFGQHLAAVRIDDCWGYISVCGRIAIEPRFLEAKSFSNGSAPVLTERGWEFITLVEYKK